MATIVENNNNKNENTTIPLTKIQEEFFTAIENGDINLVKSLIAYRNYLNRLEKEVDDLDILLKDDY